MLTTAKCLTSRDAAVERWLNKEVVPAYDAMKADPKRAISIENVFTTVREHHVARMKAPKDDATD